MEIIVNGERLQVPEQIVYVSDLLDHFKLQDKVVVVEINGDILEKNEHQNTRLSDRDRIEIVHFVGGG
ncbi:sulfur carrier protein ThiS [Bacillus sp. EB600]|uniref:sulfur carrier protein ThiS n=1 Tax=Bacillus sp. EB600 TaxID=2806345 RepID=UPI00210D4233|nr:sulfur carrier protein ThiS [Bacillus sp. EB600]MCQ6280709.1 thiamine biosynthesis protein ThiS [Bacillus sp. EB600]